jgi:hypothetical protein
VAIDVAIQAGDAQARTFAFAIVGRIEFFLRQRRDEHTQPIQLDGWFRWAAMTPGLASISAFIVSSKVCIGFFAPNGSREKSNPVTRPSSG